MKYLRILVVPMCLALILSASLEPKRAHAIFGVGDVVFDPATFAESLASAISEAGSLAESIVQTGLQYSDYTKEYVLDPLAYYAGRQLLSQAVDQTVRWVNSGFQDGAEPYFITNPEGFFKDTATKETRKFITQTTGINTIYGQDLIKRAIERNRDTYQKKLTYTLADRVLTSACKKEQRVYTDADINGLDLPADYPLFDTTEPPVYNDYDGTTDPAPVGLFNPSNLFISVANAQANPFSGILPGANTTTQNGTSQLDRATNSACAQLGKKLTKLQQKQIADQYYTDFRSGGWEAWKELTQNPANTAAGASDIASNQENTLVQTQISQKRDEILRGGGFLTDKRCVLKDEDYVSNLSAEEAAAIAPEDIPCLKYDYSTPGSIIKEQISGALTTAGFDIPTDEFSELITGIVTSVVANMAADAVFRDGGTRATTNVELPAEIGDKLNEMSDTSGGSAIDMQTKYLAVMQKFQTFYDNIIKNTSELNACQERVNREKTEKTAQFPYLTIVVSSPSFPTTNYPQTCSFDGGGAFSNPLQLLLPTAHAQFSNGCTGGVTWTYRPQQSFITDAANKENKYSAEIEAAEANIAKLRELIAMNQAAQTDEEIRAAADEYSKFIGKAKLKREGEIKLAENDYTYLTVDYQGKINTLGKSVEDLAEATKACAATTVVAVTPQSDY